MKNKVYIPIIIIISLIFAFVLNRSFLSLTPKLTTTTPTDLTIYPVVGTSDFQNTNPNFSTYFKPDPTIPESITFRKNNSSLSFFTPVKQLFGNLTPNTPQVSNNSLIYPQIYPNVDLKYSISTSKLLEEFITTNSDSAQQLTSISQQVKLTNIDRYEIKPEGSINFYHNNQHILSLPRPVLYELNTQDQRSFGIEYQIVEIDKSNLIITKHLTSDGLNWLSDPSRQYPIAIDLVIDNAETSTNWVSSNSNLLTVAQETTIKQEGTGSVKLTPTTSWYNFSWPYRLKLTIDATKVEGDLTDFPVYVNLNDLPLSFHTNVNQTDGRDIRVTKADGTTELPREIVYYNSSNDSGEMHFKYTGTLSGTSNTDIYLYYGNASASNYVATDTYGRNNVWDSSYKAILHLNEQSTATANSIIDSTVNGNHLSANATETRRPTLISSVIGNGQNFYATDAEYLYRGSTVNLGTTRGNQTMALWYKVSSIPSVIQKHYCLENSSYTTQSCMYFTSTGNIGVGSNWNSPYTQWISTTAPSATNWHHIAWTWNGTTNRFYIDGVEVTNNTTIPSVNVTIAHLWVGAGSSTNDTSEKFNGDLDEIRFSTTNRSEPWIATEYNNQFSPSTFYTPSSEETIIGQTITRSVSTTDLSGYSSLNYWVRSNRTGSFIRFQFGESNSNEQVHNFTIDNVDTWEQKTWDISGISSSARDAITKYAFYVTDSSTTFDFYFDDIQTNSTPTPTPTPGNTTIQIN